jgi:hypothetical protein
MITIPLSTEDLTKVRLAPSPLWETVASFGVLLHHDRHTMHAPWATRTRRIVPGTDLSTLLGAICIECGCPYFLTPLPIPRWPPSVRSSSAGGPHPRRSSTMRWRRTYGWRRGCSASQRKTALERGRNAGGHRRSAKSRARWKSWPLRKDREGEDLRARERYRPTRTAPRFRAVLTADRC